MDNHDEGGVWPDPRTLARISYYTGRGGATIPPDAATRHQPGTNFVHLHELITRVEDRADVERRLGDRFAGRGRNAVPEGLAVLRLHPDANPIDAIELTKDGRRLATPHLALTLGPHWAWGSATDPRPAGALDDPSGKAERHTVGVVDTGMFAPIPGGLGVGIAELDPVDRQPDGVIDWFGAAHGGFIAGIIDQRAKGTVIDVFRGFEQSSAVPSEAAVILGVDRALAAGAEIVNLSVGTYGLWKEPPLGLAHAMERWGKRFPHVLFVCAAGNDGLEDPWYPAAFTVAPGCEDRVVAVGALDADGNPAGFSNHGKWVNAWAPGVDAHSYYPKAKKFVYADGSSVYFPDGFAYWSGTSFAAPYVVAEILRHMDASSLGAVDAWRDLRNTHGPEVRFPV